MYLGIDLGTSGVKSLIIDDSHKVVAVATASLEVQRPHDGWSEQRADDWITATAETLASLQADSPAALSAVTGIGLSGQQHGATLIDKADKPLRPCILWNDTRSHAEAAELSTDANCALAGSIIFPGFTAPKLKWVEQHEPDLFGKVHKVLLPKDYLRLWLTGEYVSDMSDASGTGWMDIARRDWSPELLAAGGMAAAQMPGLVEGSEVSATLRDELAKQYGFQSAVVVAGGAGDNAASASGMGAVSNSSAFVSIGTSGVVFASNDTFRPNPATALHTFCHALPDTWHQMGVIQSATDSLNWFASTCGMSAAELTTELSKAAGDGIRAPTSTTFLPYLSGERTPHNDASIRAGFAGLTHGTDRTHMTQAVLEGVSFAFRDNFEALASAGTKPDRLFAVGGGTRSDYWLQAIATTLGVPIDLAVDGDFGAGFGAARLGQLAATGAKVNEVCTLPAVARSFEPDTSLSEAFESAYQRYRSLYPALSSIKDLNSASA